MEETKVLVTGASGYVGSRLVPELLEEGYAVRAVSRSPEKLERFRWADRDGVEFTAADALDSDSLGAACRGCDVAYYLIHSMGQGSGDFEEADRRAARNMARAAESQSLDRIVYLGGHRPEEPEEKLSKHRRSRLEVEEQLGSGEVPLTVFRAAMVVGSGSASFEMMRYSLERTPPFFVTHSYADDPTQPIAVSDLLTYLVESLEETETAGETYDVGGPDVLTNREVMKTYARVAELPEPVVLSSSLVPLGVVSFFTALLTPLASELVDPLVIGARHPSVCGDNRIHELIPQDLLSLEEAMERAHERSRPEILDRRGEEPVGPAEWPREGDPDWSGGTLYEDRRTREVDASPEAVFRTIVEIGSDNGLFFAPWFRTLVGWFDDLTGIFGFPEPREPGRPLKRGDHLDCWEILEADQPNRLKLRADVNLPGKATFDFILESDGDGTRLVQAARFRPQGLLGRIYWRILAVFHVFSFPLSLRSIARRTEAYSKS